MAILSLLKILTGGDWVTLLQSSMDSNGIDKVPKENSFVFRIWLMYYCIIVVGNVMIMNLLVGLVLDNFR